jgi:hypothetical protein
MTIMDPSQPMTASQYREACRRLGISPTYGAVTALLIPAATAGRYSRGEAEVSPRDALLIRTLLEVQELRERVAALLEGRAAE